MLLAKHNPVIPDRLGQSASWRMRASEVLTDVNRALCDTSEGARYATLAYLELDTERSQLSIINAGHLPLLVVTPDRPIKFIDSTAPALGLFPEGRFPECTVRLTDGAMVVAYSDGVT